MRNALKRRLIAIRFSQYDHSSRLPTIMYDYFVTFLLCFFSNSISSYFSPRHCFLISQKPSNLLSFPKNNLKPDMSFPGIGVLSPVRVIDGLQGVRCGRCGRRAPPIGRRYRIAASQCLQARPRWSLRSGAKGKHILVVCVRINSLASVFC